MLSLPNDLTSLPDYGWTERPEAARLDAEEVRAALWLAGGSIGRAAELMKIDRVRMNRFVRMSQYLHDEWCEIMEQRLDKCEDVVREALYSDDPKRADPTARFVLQRIGKYRGWGEIQ